MATPCRGRIVWVELVDPQGGNPKCRPAVILTEPKEVQPEAEVWVVGVTTQVETTPADQAVELPWDRKRHPRTGLKERCVAVCTWLAKIRLEAIKEYAGVVPGKQLLAILQKVDELPA